MNALRPSSSFRPLAFLVGLALSSVAAASTWTTIDTDPDLERLFGHRDVVFAARSLDGESAHALAPERIDDRRTPFSTFKIPNFLIALETGVVTDPDALSPWDPDARPAADFWPDSWRQAQSLVTAFRRSAVWFFRDIAVHIGGSRYRDDLSSFDYGNAAAADGNDGFWLDGSLRISPLEQVAFLSRMLGGRLPVESKHVDTLRAASLLQDENGCRLHGKTGAGPVGDDFDGPFEGWLVGWTQCGDAAPTVFALWTRGKRFVAIRDFRQEAATALLTRIGALSPPAVD